MLDFHLKQKQNYSLNILIILIPPNVTIEIRAFDCCENLKVFHIPRNSNLNSVNKYLFGNSFKSIDKVISPLSMITLLCNSIQTCEYYAIDDIPPKQLNLEITDEIVNLDIIANNLKNIVEICTPNALEVNLTLNCDFRELYVPRNAQLSGEKMLNNKHRIIFYKRESLSLEIMDSDEFEELYQKANTKKPIGEGATSIVYKIPNENIPNTYFALKVYKCHNREKDESEEENKNETKFTKEIRKIDESGEDHNEDQNKIQKQVKEDKKLSKNKIIEKEDMKESVDKSSEELNNTNEEEKKEGVTRSKDKSNDEPNKENKHDEINNIDKNKSSDTISIVNKQDPLSTCSQTQSNIQENKSNQEEKDNKSIETVFSWGSYGSTYSSDFEFNNPFDLFQNGFKGNYTSYGKFRLTLHTTKYFVPSK